MKSQIQIRHPNPQATLDLIYELIEEALDASADFGAAQFVKDSDMVYAELNLERATEKLYNAINILMESNNK